MASEHPRIKVTHTFSIGEYDTVVVTRHVFIDGEELASVEGLYRYELVPNNGLVSINLPNGTARGNGQEG